MRPLTVDGGYDNVLLGQDYRTAHGAVIDEHVEEWRNDIDRIKPKNLDKNLPQCYFFHHKSHMD
jgi:hypothetical protein